MHTDSRPLPEGRRLGPYVIQRRLGRGGMGEVYLAHDTALDRLVAIKTLAARFAHDPVLVQRFQREARASARLNHANIVQVYAVDIDANPPYMVMEYVEGSSLDHIISPESPLPWQRALVICEQVAAALACAHAEGIIHRDIKPANILVDKLGRARVADFGIAKVLGVQTQLTREQMTIGSPCYMSPEQCGVGDVVGASDLFALGITVFEMISGRLPFQAETTVGIINKITSAPLPRLGDYVSDVPVVVQELVEALTAKRLVERYASANHVEEDIRAFRTGRPLGHLQRLRPQAAAADVAPAPSLVDELLGGGETPFSKPLPPAPREFPWRVIGLAALVIVVIALIWGIAQSGLHKGAEGPPAPAPIATVQPRPEPPERAPANAEPQFNPQQGPPPRNSADGTAPPPRRGPGQFGDQGRPGYPPPPGFRPGGPPPPRPDGQGPPPPRPQ